MRCMQYSAASPQNAVSAARLVHPDKVPIRNNFNPMRIAHNPAKSGCEKDLTAQPRFPQVVHCPPGIFRRSQMEEGSKQGNRNRHTGCHEWQQGDPAGNQFIVEPPINQTDCPECTDRHLHKQGENDERNFASSCCTGICWRGFFSIAYLGPLANLFYPGVRFDDQMRFCS